MNIGKRLSVALQTKNIKTKDIVNKFNITQQQVSNIKKADKLNDTIANIATNYCINLNWLFLGEGEMFTDESGGNEKNVHDGILKLVEALNNVADALNYKKEN